MVRLSGRLSTRRTVSPMFASFCSSWACSVELVRTIFLYLRCGRAMSMRTVIVLSALSETTTPWRTLSWPRRLGLGGAGASARGWPARFSRCFCAVGAPMRGLAAARSARSCARSSMERGGRASPVCVDARACALLGRELLLGLGVLGGGGGGGRPRRRAPRRRALLSSGPPRRRASSAAGSSAAGSSAGASSAAGSSAAGLLGGGLLGGGPPRQRPPRAGGRPPPRAPPGAAASGAASSAASSGVCSSFTFSSFSVIRLSLRISVSTSMPRWRATVSARARSVFAASAARCSRAGPWRAGSAG